MQTSSHALDGAVLRYLLALVVLTACTDTVPTAVEPETSRANAHLSRAQLITSSLRTPDDEFLRLNDELPGFGGLFFDRDGVPQVFLTQPSERERAMTAVDAYLVRQGVPTIAAGLVVHQAQYEFRQLAAWHHLFKQRADLSGVTLMDVDDMMNRFTIGVSDAAVIPRVRQQLQLIGIPEAAVVFEIRERPVLLSSLRDLYTPRIAGLQISRTPTPTSGHAR